MLICPNCGEENPDRFRLCGFCGSELAPSVPSLQVRKTVTVLFCDLKGSTELGGRVDTESLREILSHYFTEMSLILDRHGGRVEKYIGDAIMAVFGLPRAHEDDALRAVRAAADMQLALAGINQELERRWGVSIANRTGLNTGEVVAGDVTEGQQLVTGDVVNVAARLEQAAGEREVLIGETTYHLVRDAVEVERLEPLSLKGKVEPVPAYRLLSVKEGEAITRRLDSPMVGRAAELEALRESFVGAFLDRRCRLVTVFGQAGVGKSRLVHELAESISGEALVLHGRCLPYGKGITFWPLAEVVRQAAAIGQEDPPEEAKSRLAALLDDYGDGAEVTERLAGVLGLTTETFSVEETFWAARKLLEALARIRPVIVEIDDIHWAEPTFLDLIEHVASSARDAPLLLVCTARPDLLEDHPSWGEGADRGRIFIEPLSPDESIRILENLLDGVSLPDEVCERIIAAAEGNPLFVEQMLSMLLDQGLVSRDVDGRWVVSADLESLTVPPSIFALLNARLDRLPTSERAVLERGSVGGSVFFRGAVVALSPETLRPEVPAALAALGRKQFIRPDRTDFPDEEAFRFEHVLIRDAAYRAMLKRARIGLHEAFADWLEQAAGTLIEYEEIRGYHLEQGYRYRSELGPLDEAGLAVGHRAAQLLASSGLRAFGRSDMPAAANLLERAASLLPVDDSIRLSLLPNLGEALMDLGQFTRAEELLEEAVQRAATLQDRRLEADALVVQLLVRASVEEGSWAQDILLRSREAVARLEEAGDGIGAARAWRLIGFVQGTAGQYGAAEEALRQAIELARLAGDRRQETRNLPIYAACVLYGPTPVQEAINRCEELLKEATGSQRGEALIRLALAQLHAMRGEFDLARDIYRQSRAILADLGEKVLAARTSSDSGRVEMLAENPEAAEQELLRDYQALDMMGEKYFLSTVAGLLAHALYLQGRFEEAERYSRVSEEVAGDDIESLALSRRARAKVLARWGQFVEGEALAQEAVKYSMQTDSPVLQGNTLLDLSEILRLAGRSGEAVPFIRQAIELFEQKGNTVSADRARKILGELTAV